MDVLLKLSFKVFQNTFQRNGKFTLSLVLRIVTKILMKFEKSILSNSSNNREMFHY